jgi:hypothetical protein
LTARIAADAEIAIRSIGKEKQMPKGEQRSNKMTKKPKKDTGPVKESVIVTNRPAPPVTTVMPKGKMKNK